MRKNLKIMKYQQKNELLRIVKNAKLKGRCSYDNCQENPINSHSISKSLLKLIAKEGKVITFENNFFKVGSSEGTIKEKVQGISKATTFPGFCNSHDNIIFEEIDNLPFDLSNKQAFLYLFRAISRAIIHKEQTIFLLDEIYKRNNNKKLIDELKNFKMGTLIGILNLKQQKEYLDKYLLENNFTNVRFTLFYMDGNPQILFSGLTFPDYDFQGREIQDLSKTENLLGLLSFSSVKLPGGWGILFVWDSKSDYACLNLFNSLKEYIKGENLDRKSSEALTRFIISKCDTNAFDIGWWEKLNKSQKNDIKLSLNNLVKYPAVDPKDDLIFGLQDLFNFKISKISENY